MTGRQCKQIITKLYFLSIISNLLVFNLVRSIIRFCFLLLANGARRALQCFGSAQQTAQCFRLLQTQKPAVLKRLVLFNLSRPWLRPGLPRLVAYYNLVLPLL
jgi:hypothetical protein